MSSGRWLMRGRVFLGRVFAGRVLADSGVAPVVATSVRTHIFQLVGTSQRVYSMVGTNQRIHTISGTQP